MSKKSQPSPLKSFIAGGVGGICSVLSCQPFDTVKVRMQNQAGTALYKNARDCVVKTVKAEGPLALYKGMALPIVGVAPVFAIEFLGYSHGKMLQGNKDLSILQHGLAGSLGGLYMSVIIAPAERIKCLLQIQTTGKGQYSGPLDVIKQLYKEGGIRNITRGTAVTALRDVPAAGCYFGSYEGMKRFLRTDNNSDGPDRELTTSDILLAGGSAGIAYWIWAIGPDVIKTKLQTAPARMYPKGVRSVVPMLLRTEGLKGFLKGSGPAMLRAFPAHACCFTGYEVVLKVMDYIAPIPVY